MHRPRPAPILLVALSAIASGCLTVGRVAPPPSPLPAPAAAPRIVYALGDFTFRMNDGEARPSYFDARLLSDGLFAVWERRGYVREAKRVDRQELAGNADYAIVVSGGVHAETSFWAELLNALTLLLVPYSVTTTYDLHVAVVPAAGGMPCVASARSSDRAWIGLLLVVGAPFAERGYDEEVARIADALYADLRWQGALGPTDVAPAAAAHFGRVGGS